MALVAFVKSCSLRAGTKTEISMEENMYKYVR